MENNTDSLIIMQQTVQYSIEDTFIDKIKECLKSLKAIDLILMRYNSSKRNVRLNLEIEYTKIMISMIIPILNAFISDLNIEEYKKKILILIENFKNLIDVLDIKYKLLKTQYFCTQEKYLFIRNFDLLLKSKVFLKTKSGLTFLRFLLYYIQKLEDKLTEIYIKDFDLTRNELIKYSYKNAHIKHVSQVIHYYLFPTRESIFNLKSNHERWMNIMQNTEIKMTTPIENGKMLNKLLYFGTNLNFSLFYKVDIHKFSMYNPLDNLKIIFYSLYYLFNPSVANQMRKRYSLTPNIDVIEKVSSVAESLFVNFFYRFTLNYIKVNHVKYVNIDKEIDSKLYEVKEIRGKEKNYSKIRILSGKSLNYNFNPEQINSYNSNEKTFLNYLGLSLNMNQNDLMCFNLVIHVHGGGYFSQSTESHLGYLINFSNTLNSIVIGIDYKLAPISKFPDIFDENYKVYRKIVQNCEKLFGFKINKLALSGDSCGGHFCLNILKNCIKDNIKKPDGLLLIYPSTRVIFDNMSPSFGMSCRDPLIQISLLGHTQNTVLELEKFKLENYHDQDTLNFFLTDSSIIKQFPKTFIIVATNDPLKDESYMLADFLLQNNVDLKIKEFLSFCHGFMNMTGLVSFLKEGENECIKCIDEIFKL